MWEPVAKPRVGCARVFSKNAVAMVADRNVLRHTAADDLHMNDELKFVGQTIYTISDYGPTLPARASERLVQDVRAAMAQLSIDGTLKGLHQKWFGFELYRPPWWKRVRHSAWFWPGVVVLALAPVGLVWWWSIQRSARVRTHRLTGEMEVLRKQLAELQNRAPGEVQLPGQEALPGPAAAGRSAVLEPMNVNAFLQRDLEIFRQAVGPQTTLVLQLGQDLPMVMATRAQVRTAVINLCTNARDAIAEQHRTAGEAPGRVTILTRRANPSEIPAARQGAGAVYIAIGVHDNGCGIEKKDVQKIFQAGYTTKLRAAGQGLAIVYSAVAAHGGWIDVESAPGRGATFSIFLPAM
jgi:hypothetical protein